MRCSAGESIWKQGYVLLHIKVFQRNQVYISRACVLVTFLSVMATLKELSRESVLLSMGNVHYCVGESVLKRGFIF